MTTSIGRIVVYHDTEGCDYPAIIVRVWSDTMVNLNVFRDAGVAAVTSVQLFNPLYHGPRLPNTWEWPVITPTA